MPWHDLQEGGGQVVVALVVQGVAHAEGGCLEGTVFRHARTVGHQETSVDALALTTYEQSRRAEMGTVNPNCLPNPSSCAEIAK
ncbi:hypothetical protein GCM10027601_24950 [Nocardioides ungokensis]